MELVTLFLATVNSDPDIWDKFGKFLIFSDMVPPRLLLEAEENYLKLLKLQFPDLDWLLSEQSFLRLISMVNLNSFSVMTCAPEFRLATETGESNPDETVKDDRHPIPDGTVKDDRNTIKDDRNTVKDNRDTVKDDRNTVKDDRNTVKDDRDTVKDDRNTVKDDRDTVKDDRNTVKDNGDTVKDNGDTVKDDNTVKDNRDTVKDDRDTVKDNRDTVKDDRHPLPDGTVKDNHHPPDMSDEPDLTLQVSFDPPYVIGHAMYRLSSFMNHSCTPNTEISFPTFTTKTTWVAQKPIQEGEEIFCCYVDLESVGGDPNLRRQMLYSCYKFLCSGDCDACKAMGVEELEEEDLE